MYVHGGHTALAIKAPPQTVRNAGYFYGNANTENFACGKEPEVILSSTHGVSSGSYQEMVSQTTPTGEGEEDHKFLCKYFHYD